MMILKSLQIGIRHRFGKSNLPVNQNHIILFRFAYHLFVWRASFKVVSGAEIGAPIIFPSYQKHIIFLDFFFKVKEPPSSRYRAPKSERPNSLLPPEARHITYDNLKRLFKIIISDMTCFKIKLNETCTSFIKI
jgi:hypothetical protein